MAFSLLPPPTRVLQLLLVVAGVLTLTSAQSSADVELRVEEERGVGSPVVDVSQYPQLFLGADRAKLTFDILDKDSFDAAFFRVLDPQSGVITVAKRIDREVICGSDPACDLQFNMAITGRDGQSFSNIASVRIFVDDINDNSPNFPADQVTLDISEGAKVGTVLKVSGPQDLDSPPNNTIQRYEVTLTQPVFSVSDTKNPDGSIVINLKLEQELDREKAAEYDFNIIAYDGGDPPRSDFLRVIVKVTDMNDNTPEFESRNYSVSLREDSPRGTPVITVRASDKDAGSFGQVEYRLSSLSSSQTRALFALNATTGAISLTAPLPPHSAGAAPYTVVVEAKDGGVPPAVAQTVVTVTVLNTGNNPPTVKIVTVSEGETTELSLVESAKANDFVAFVNVEDSDEGANGAVSCALIDTAQFSLEELPNKGYKVLLAGAVDRETVSRYEAVISCSDSGSPPLTTETPFTVIITDINDNTPTFDQVGYAASITENNAAGQYLVTVTATDRDADHNAVITYSFLEAAAGELLSVHPQSGVVAAKAVLDREKTPVLRFTVLAVDGGDEARTGSAGLTVTVRDANDNAPQLRHAPYRMDVSEGASPGLLLGTMGASDVDEGDNGKVDFFYAGSVSGEVPFTVHTNGTIEVSGILDRETSDSYVFTVLARDRGAIPKSNSTQVTIRVTDINDNAPVILFPTNVNHSVVITTRQQEGTILGRVIAYDVDEGNASSLVYVIHSGDADGVFNADPETGKIFLADVSRLRNPFSYTIVLRVYDQGVPPLYAETRLQVDINFPNNTDFFTPVGVSVGGGGGGGDQQQLEEEKKQHDSYVIIVGVIGGATLVLSGIIIGAIFFVLRSESKRKTRERDGSSGGGSSSVVKNDYVPAPTKAGSGFGDVMSDDVKSPQQSPAHHHHHHRHSSDFSSSPHRLPSSTTSNGDHFSTSGVILSPKTLPPSQRLDVQKKVSFSLDEPDAEVRQIASREELRQQQSRDMLGGAGQPHHQDAGAMEAWKRLASPDDMNSDTSGDSGTCDSGRGASDDDIHLDQYMDKHAGSQSTTPALTNTNRTPAPSNIYSPPSFAAATGTGSFRGGQGQGHNRQGHFPGQGQGSGSRPRFLPTTGGSYHEGRPRDNSSNYNRGKAALLQPPPTAARPTRAQQHHLHPQQDFASPNSSSSAASYPQQPYHPQSLSSPRHQSQVVSLHPEPVSAASSWRQSGSRHSLDLAENGAGGGGGGSGVRGEREREGWLPPPRSSSSMSYQRQGSWQGSVAGSQGMEGYQGSALSVDLDDAASTTTSGSYTISPDELRLEGLLSPDVIV